MDSSHLEHDDEYCCCPQCPICIEASQHSRRPPHRNSQQNILEAATETQSATGLGTPCGNCEMRRYSTSYHASSTNEAMPTWISESDQSSIKVELPVSDKPLVELIMKIRIKKVPYSLLEETPQAVAQSAQIAYNLERRFAAKRAAEAALPASIPKKRRRKHHHRQRAFQSIIRFPDNNNPTNVVNKVIYENLQPTDVVVPDFVSPRKPSDEEERIPEEATPLIIVYYRPLTLEDSLIETVNKVKMKVYQQLPKPVKNTSTLENFQQLGSREQHIARKFPKEYRCCAKNNVPLSQAFSLYNSTNY